MTAQTFSDCRIWLDGRDLTGDTNETALEWTVEERPVQTFGSGGTIPNLAGLKTVALSMSGIWEAGGGVEVDDTLTDVLGMEDVVVLLSPTANAGPGDKACFFKSLVSQYSPSVVVGEEIRFTVQAAVSDGPLVNGVMAVNRVPLTRPRDTNASSPSRMLGPVPAGAAMYAAFQVTSSMGTRQILNAKLSSAPSNQFTGRETVRATFPPINRPGGFMVSVPGPVTDRWWKLQWQIQGTAPDFSGVAAMGISAL